MDLLKKSAAGVLVYLFAFPGLVFAQNTPKDASGILQLEQMFLRVLNLIVGFSFVVLLIMLLVGGIRYLTSGGEPKAIQAAGQTMTWALLGMFFLILAWLVLLLVKAFTGVDVTIFNLTLFCGDGNVDCRL